MKIDSVPDFRKGLCDSIQLLQDKILGRSPVFDSPTLLRENFENLFRIKSRNDQFILALGVLQWEFPEEVRCLIYLALCDIRDKWISGVPVDHIDYETLEEKEKNLDSYHRVLSLMIILDSRDHCIQYLKDVNDKKGIFSSTSAFFGYLSSVEFQEEFRRTVVPVFTSNKKPKIPVWRRGYKDKGTLPENYPYSRPKESLQNQQLEIEAERQSYYDTLEFVKGWMDWGVEDPEDPLFEEFITKEKE
jgi:hypothetical protein